MAVGDVDGEPAIMLITDDAHVRKLKADEARTSPTAVFNNAAQLICFLDSFLPSNVGHAMVDPNSHTGFTNTIADVYMQAAVAIE